MNIAKEEMCDINKWKKGNDPASTAQAENGGRSGPIYLSCFGNGNDGCFSTVTRLIFWEWARLLFKDGEK